MPVKIGVDNLPGRAKDSPFFAEVVTLFFGHHRPTGPPRAQAALVLPSCLTALTEKRDDFTHVIGPEP